MGWSVYLKQKLCCFCLAGTCVSVDSCNFTLNVYKFGLCGSVFFPVDSHVFEDKV